MNPSSLFEKALKLALAEHEAGHFFNAEKLYRSALRFQPDHEQANYHLGLLAFHKGFFDEAAQYFERVLGIKPENQDYWIDLINALIKNDQIEKAKNVIAVGKQHGLSGLELKKIEDFLEFKNNETTLFEKCIARFDRATEKRQASAVETKKLCFYIENHEFKKAKKLALALIKKFPRDIVSWQVLSNIYYENGLHLWALYISKRLTEIKPNDAEILRNFAFALQNMNNLEEAEEIFLKSLSNINSDSIKNKKIVYQNLLFLNNYSAKKNKDDIFCFYKNCDNNIYVKKIVNFKTKKKDPERLLKIGYVSPDFRKHAVRNFIEPVVAHHNKNFFETYSYAQIKEKNIKNKTSRKKEEWWSVSFFHEDEITERFKTLIPFWRSTHEMTDSEVANQIVDDDIDILVDLAGHTIGNRLEVFAMKPAPVSMTWIGYGYTTGLYAIDYFLCDSVMVPEGYESIFSEKPWRLPVPWCVYRPDERMGEPRAEINRPGHVIFGSFSRSIRINDRVIAVWAEILKRVAGSRLLLNSLSFDSADIRKQIAERFADFGIPFNRLIMGYTSPPYEIMKEVDIGLDCFPHNSGTTLMETLYMGIPFVTLADRPSVGRIGSSALHGVGLTELIATSEQAYIELAVALAKDEARLEQLKKNLRPMLQKSPLMDEVGFTRQLEDAYRQMWQLYCEKPE